MLAWWDVKLVCGIIRDGEKMGGGAGGRTALQVTGCTCAGGGRVCCSATNLPRGGKPGVRSHTQTHPQNGHWGAQMLQEPAWSRAGQTMQTLLTAGPRFSPAHKARTGTAEDKGFQGCTFSLCLGQAFYALQKPKNG